MGRRSYVPRSRFELLLRNLGRLATEGRRLSPSPRLHGQKRLAGARCVLVLRKWRVSRGPENATCGAGRDTCDNRQLANHSLEPSAHSQGEFRSWRQSSWLHLPEADWTGSLENSEPRQRPYEHLGYWQQRCETCPPG